MQASCFHDTWTLVLRPRNVTDGLKVMVWQGLGFMPFKGSSLTGCAPAAAAVSATSASWKQQEQCSLLLPLWVTLIQSQFAAT